jgi:lysophospholipase L1-like esterase
VAAVAVAALLTAAVLGAPLARADEPPRYVAMGDSSAAGPGIPDQVDAGCVRSNRNWPSYLGKILGVTPTDVTCTSATLASSVSQLGALSDDTDLVTIAIGANDIEMWQAFVHCGQPVDAAGCREILATRGVDFDARISALGAQFRARLRAIRDESAPDVRVFVVGYLTYWSPGGCPDRDAYSSSVADFMQDTFDKLMDGMETWADQENATYVDIRTPSRNHGLCQTGGSERWLDGNVAPPRYAYHPNALGMCHAATIIGRAIEGPSVEDPGCAAAAG